VTGIKNSLRDRRGYTTTAAESETTHHEGAADRKALYKDVIEFLKRASA